jgi:hypothetical protein
LKIKCPLLLRIGKFIEMRSALKPLRNIWSPLYVIAWFALVFLGEALWHMFA